MQKLERGEKNAMEVKLFEVRDRATFIPVMAIKLEPKNEAERFLLARSGFGRLPQDQRNYTMVIKIATNEINFDRHLWRPGRTMSAAHHHIEQEWHNLRSGDVIDVEFVLGETTAAKRSEAKETMPTESDVHGTLS